MSVKKSAILGSIPIIWAFLSYWIFPMLFGGQPSPLDMTFGFGLFHALVEAAIIFVASYVLFKWF